MKDSAEKPLDLSAQIATSIRDSIISGALNVDTRLPSESELSEEFNVSRSTIREALKRLAAQSLIRTQRGASGGAFVNKLTFQEAYGQQITTSTLLLSMNEVSLVTACEARFAMERACIPLASERRKPEQLKTMRSEIQKQTLKSLSDEDFCASDVAFHRALVDAAHNPVLSFQLAGAVEAMQPLMNMVTYTARDRVRIVAFHSNIADAIEDHDADLAEFTLQNLEAYTIELAHSVLQEKAGARKTAD
ncbi:MAG: FadR/GntR family transcriptional regulator [Pseudomonadota bacterium]